jgi:hypothetical protein
MDNEQIKQVRAQAVKMISRAGIEITADERESMEIADLGLGEFERTGLAIVVYVNTARYCAKELVMLPGQTCTRHSLTSALATGACSVEKPDATSGIPVWDGLQERMQSNQLRRKENAVY